MRPLRDRRVAALTLAAGMSAGAAACAPASAYDTSSFCAALNQVRVSAIDIVAVVHDVPPAQRRALRNELGEDVESVREVAEDTQSLDQADAASAVSAAFAGVDAAVRRAGGSPGGQATVPAWLALRRLRVAADRGAATLGCPLPTPPVPLDPPSPSPQPSGSPSPSESPSPTPGQSGSPTPGTSPSPTPLPSTSGLPSPVPSGIPTPGGTGSPRVPWPERIL